MAKIRLKKKPREGLLRQEEGFGLFGAVKYLLKPFGLVVHATISIQYSLSYFAAA